MTAAWQQLLKASLRFISCDCLLLGQTSKHKKSQSSTYCNAASLTANLIVNRSSFEQNIFTQSPEVRIWGRECWEADCPSLIWVRTRVPNNGWCLFNRHKSGRLSRRWALLHCPQSFPQNQRQFAGQETWVDLWSSVFDWRKCSKGRPVRTSLTRSPFSWQRARHVSRLLPNLKLLEFHYLWGPVSDLLKSKHANSDSCKHQATPQPHEWRSNNYEIHGKTSLTNIWVRKVYRLVWSLHQITLR